MSDEAAPRPGLADLSPEARQLVIEAQLSTAGRRLRDLLAAAASDDRESTGQLATAFGSDLARLDMADVCAAAANLAAAASSGDPLGAPALALARAYEAAKARWRGGGGPAAAP